MEHTVYQVESQSIRRGWMETGSGSGSRLSGLAFVLFALDISSVSIE